MATSTSRAGKVGSMLRLLELDVAHLAATRFAISPLADGGARSLFGALLGAGSASSGASAS
jgi:hypothetical protein